METETRLNFGVDCGVYGVLSQTMMQAILERGLPEIASFTVTSEAKIDAVIKVINSDAIKKVYTHAPTDEREKEQWQHKFFDLGDTVIFVAVSSQYNWDVRGASNNRKALDDLMEAIKAVLPIMKSEDPNVVPVNFWAIDAQGRVACRTRRIAVPAWADVRLNYSAKSREGLETLMNLWPPLEDNGRLLLWHGIPGTGKSYGIRSLAQAWQKWCEVNYIVDPEKFFGSADYMLQVVLQSADEGSGSPALVGASDDQSDGQERVYKGHPWSLLIMEDSDEFLTSDAKVRSGQSMSRLLNLTSGFIGQGLNTLVLITTNEPIDSIHKALQREGRCMANVEFGKLDGAEVLEWAADNGVTVAPDKQHGGTTIADLYALTRQQRQLRTGPVKPKLGFAVRS